MRLIAGLGNPGNKYKSTRHNFGLLAVDSFAKRYNFSFKKYRDFTFSKQQKFILLKPSTYMNESGLAIFKILSMFDFDEILIITDDVNLPFGDIRLRKSGSAGGHNGLKSIERFLGSNEFNRMRLGVGGGELKQLKKYVLSNFTNEQKKKISSICEFTSKLLDKYIMDGMEQMLNYFSKNKTAYSKQMDLESLKKDQRRKT